MFSHKKDLDYTELYRKLGIKVINNEPHYDSIESLELFLAKRNNTIDISLGDKAIHDFIKQIDYYQKQCYTFGVLTMDNICVIDENIFLIENAELLPIVDKYYVNINSVYSKENILLPPELRENTEIPFKTRITLCYYTIGKIVQKIIFKTENPSEQQQKSVLDSSPLFFCLLRATKEKPNHRYLIYI
jgi:hypothetical protein